MSSDFLQVLIDGPLAGSFSYRLPAPAVSAGKASAPAEKGKGPQDDTRASTPDSEPLVRLPIHAAEGASQPSQEEGGAPHALSLPAWVTVPWGKGRRTGLAVGPGNTLPPGLSSDDVKPIEAVRDDIPAPPADWLRFLRFVAQYYHGNLADLAVGNLPKLLRTPPTERSRKNGHARLKAFNQQHLAGLPADGSPPAGDDNRIPELNAAQQQVLDALRTGTNGEDGPPAKPLPWLLHGITGSGKTEVYLHWMQHLLSTRPDAQILLLVPEIGLTPALQRQLQSRFPRETLAVLHSDMPDGLRAAHWLAAATGTARIVLGTRLAVLAPIPRLCAIIIDEEHDPSYKQQEGLRYSARDMAVARANLAGVPMLLGSATPALESWHNAHLGRYRLLRLTERARQNATLPAIRLVNLRGVKTHEGLTDESIQAIRQTLARNEQALLFLNRRGYAPVLSCDACGWLSNCDRCDTYRVLHRVPAPQLASGRRYHLICHHCGTGQPVPRACPNCGNQDLAPLGRGTQKLEDALSTLFPEARIGRLDADVARKRGATEAFLASVHAGETDLLVGTQMLAKGHDFDRLTLVIVVDADPGLFTTNFRAPERLFATLMQVAGRAGRHTSQHAQTLIQTRHPDHPLFAALKRHDYPSFAKSQLEERELGALPPFGYQALLTAQARDMESALGFLSKAREHLLTLQDQLLAQPRESRLQEHSNPARTDLAPPAHTQAAVSQPTHSQQQDNGNFLPQPAHHLHSAQSILHAESLAQNSKTPVNVAQAHASRDGQMPVRAFPPHPQNGHATPTPTSGNTNPSASNSSEPFINICDPVPMPLAQINKVCRAQLLIESTHRASLHTLLARWQASVDASGEAARAGKAGSRRNDLRWQLIIDPQEI